MMQIHTRKKSVGLKLLTAIEGVSLTVFNAQLMEIVSGSSTSLILLSDKSSNVQSAKKVFEHLRYFVSKNLY